MRLRNLAKICPHKAPWHRQCLAPSACGTTRPGAVGHEQLETYKHKQKPGFNWHWSERPSEIWVRWRIRRGGVGKWEPRLQFRTLDLVPGCMRPLRVTGSRGLFLLGVPPRAAYLSLSELKTERNPGHFCHGRDWSVVCFLTQNT